MMEYFGYDLKNEKKPWEGGEKSSLAEETGYEKVLWQKQSGLFEELKGHCE